MHMSREVQPDGREASVLLCLACAHGVTVPANHHLISFSKDLLHFPLPFTHISAQKRVKLPLLQRPLRIRTPPHKRTYPGSTRLKLPRGTKLQPVWELNMEKEAGDGITMAVPPTSEHKVQGGWPWPSSTFKHCFALLLRIYYILIVHWSQNAVNIALALGSLLLGFIPQKSAFGAWGANMLLQPQ